MYKDKEKYQEYQKQWRKGHPRYFKEYYQALKDGEHRVYKSKHRAYKSLFRRVINLVEGYNKKGGNNE